MNPLAAIRAYATPILLTAIVILVAGLAAFGKVQTARLNAEKAAFSAYKAQVEALGREAEKAAKKAESDNLAAKKRADTENAKTKRDLAGVTDAYRKLRDQRANSGYLPAAAPGAPSPERACFDRASLNSAISDFDRGAASLVEKGDAAITDLNSAKLWSQSIPTP